MTSFPESLPDAEAGYASDLEFLQDALEWVQARVMRMHAQGPVKVEGPVEPDRYDEASYEAYRRREAHIAQWSNEEERTGARLAARREATRRAGQPLALDRLQEIHGLGEVERMAILLTTAPCLDLRYGSILGTLDDTDGGDEITVNTVFHFLEMPLAERVRARALFTPSGRLARNGLLRIDMDWSWRDAGDLLRSQLSIAPGTFRFLLGEETLAEELGEFSSLEEPKADFDRLVLPERERRRILSVVEEREAFLRSFDGWGLGDTVRYGKGALLLFHGPPGTGKTMTAHAVAHRLGRRIITVHAGLLGRGGSSEVLPALFREARVHGALLFFDECEELFDVWRTGKELLTQMERFEGVAVLATNEPGGLDEAFLRRILVRVRFERPGRDARLRIWRGHLPEEAPLAADVDLEALASRWELTGGTIKNAVVAAAAQAFHEDGEGAAIAQRHLEQAAAEQADGSLESLGELTGPGVARPRLEDLVLEPGLRRRVDELVAAARDRRTVLDRWGLDPRQGRGKGVAALLSGPPGTGKTLCAEAVATALDRPLLRVSVPEVLSMWVGGTEKNIERVFGQAGASRAVLLLDECDSLLRDRAQLEQQHGRSAVNVLLQRIEAHEGLVLLVTNHDEDLDRALERRLSYRLRFPMPGPEERASLWRKLLGEAPREEPIDFGALGRDWVLSGGHIRNAIFQAAFRAAREDRAVRHDDLEEAAAEQAEDGEGIESSARLGFRP